jgi:AGCS family alanine or glycine:cation symporter
MGERIITLANHLWGAEHIGGAVLAACFIATGLYLTVRMGFPQVRYLGHAIAAAAGRFHRAGDPGEVTHFRALSAALGGSMGIDAVVGVAAAISFGGPGAVFWLWVAAVAVMATKLAESTLAVHFRVTSPDGTVTGGPMTSIVKGMHRRLGFLGWVFAAAAVLASFGLGNMVQANAVAEQVHAASSRHLGFAVPHWAAGAVMAVLIALVVLGGIKRVAAVASRLVPLLIVAYVIGAIAVVIAHWDRVPEAFSTILGCAFSGTAATGGFVGATLAQAIRWGLARGAFSSEAGLGSSAIAHAAARTAEPVRQGLVAMLEPVVDTLCVATVSALAIVSTGVWQERIEQRLDLEDVTFYARPVTTPEEAAEESNVLNGVLRVRGGTILGTVSFFEGRSSVDRPFILSPDGDGFGGALLIQRGRLVGAQVDVPDRGLVPATPEERRGLGLRGEALATGPTLAAAAFERAFPGVGGVFVTVALVLFAFATALSWCAYGDRCVGFLFGFKAVLPYRILFCAAHVLGAIVAVRVVWAAADVALALMAVPNLLCLWALAPLAAQLRRQYFGLAPKTSEAGEGEGEPSQKGRAGRSRSKRRG